MADDPVMLSGAADSRLGTAGRLRVMAACGPTVQLTADHARGIAAELDAGEAVARSCAELLAELRRLQASNAELIEAGARAAADAALWRLAALAAVPLAAVLAMMVLVGG